MIITLDLDGVLADLPKAFCKEVNKKYRNEIKVSQLCNYQLGDYIPAEDKGWLETLFHDPVFYKKIEPMLGAVEFVHKLGNVFDLYVVTARPEEVDKQTRKYVKKYFPNVKGLFRVDFPEQKLTIIQELMADFHFEDYPELCACLAINGIRTCIFDHPFNRELDKSFSHSNLKRIYSWLQFENYILQFPATDSWTLTLKELNLNGY